MGGLRWSEPGLGAGLRQAGQQVADGDPLGAGNIIDPAGGRGRGDRIHQGAGFFAEFRFAESCSEGSILSQVAHPILQDGGSVSLQYLRNTIVGKLWWHLRVSR